MGKEYWASSDALYSAYEAWARSENLQVMAKVSFGRKLSERPEGFVSKKRDKVRGWEGLMLGKPKLHLASATNEKR